MQKRLPSSRIPVMAAALLAWPSIAAAQSPDGHGIMEGTPAKLVENVTVHKQLDTVEILAVPARLSADRQCDKCQADWPYAVLRRKLSISNIRDSLDRIEIRCERHRVVDEVRSDSFWTLPDEWGECRVVVFGDEGATFDLHEIEPALQAL